MITVHNSEPQKQAKGEIKMVTQDKMYITAEEVAQILGVSKGYAYRVIRILNAELSQKGFHVIAGKVSTKYFEEKFYGMSMMAE